MWKSSKSKMAPAEPLLDPVTLPWFVSLGANGESQCFSFFFEGQYCGNVHIRKFVVRFIEAVLCCLFVCLFVCLVVVDVFTSVTIVVLHPELEISTLSGAHI